MQYVLAVMAFAAFAQSAAVVTGTHPLGEVHPGRPLVATLRATPGVPLVSCVGAGWTPRRLGAPVHLTVFR